MGRAGDGVEVRPSSIRLGFVLNGEPVRETLRINGRPMAPTVPNIAFARRLAGKIRTAIERGTFTWAEFFPDSPRARTEATEAPATFGALARLWLAAIGGTSPATQAQYRTAANFWIALLGDDRPLAEVTHKLLASKIGGYPWSSAKQHNNYLIALRGIIALEYSGPRALLAPTVGLDNKKVPRRLPDPLSAAERDRVLADLRSHYDIRVYAYFLWQFYTGMRPEETIALRWSDIDAASGVARVQRVRTFRGSELDETKTKVDRDVDLLPQALEALELMKPFTSMLRDDTRESGAADVFQNPVTGRPWHDERAQRDAYWRPSLKRLGLRWRRAYATRHTFATAALMAGVPPAYIAAQLGHSVQMLLDRYARWLPGGDGGAARRMLAAALAGPVSSPEPPQTQPGGAKVLNLQEKSGRRDWTRTKKRG